MFFIKKIITFIFAEYFAGILVTAILLLTWTFIPSGYDHLEYRSMEDLLLAPIVYSIFKVISGYYVYLFIFLKVTKNLYEQVKIKHLFVIAVIAAGSILILLFISALRDGQDFNDWRKGVIRLSEWYFSPNKQWSIWVYSGFFTTIFSPFIYKIFFLFMKGKSSLN